MSLSTFSRAAFARTAFVGAAALCGRTGFAQQTIELSAARCSSCLTANRLATLRPEAADEGIGGSDPAFARDSHGRIYLADDMVPGRIYVFDSTGAFILVFGRRGSGPAEYQRIRQIRITGGDTLHVFDDGTRRHTVLSPVPAVRPVRFAPYPGSNRSLVLLDDGRVVIGRPLATKDRDRLPLHLSAESGDIALSFGDRLDQWRGDFQQIAGRSLCRAGPHEIWAAHFIEYRIERWSTDGQRKQTLTRGTPWFKPWTSPDARLGDAPPQSRLTSIACDTSGRIWVSIAVADAEWRTALRRARGEYGEQRWVIDDENRYYDTVLEVIDPKSAQVLASRRIDQLLSEFIVAGIAWTTAVGAGGERIFEVWNVRYTPP